MEPRVDAFRVAWLSPAMPGIAFWYFLNEWQAQLALLTLHRRG